MNHLLTLTLLAIGIAGVTAATTTTAAEQDTRCFEMRVYYAPPGKLDALNARFRDHTLRLFEKHGIANIGYWMPIDNKDNKLTYILAYPNREARDKSWKAFMADPEWQKAYKESEINGKLVAKVEQTFLTATDYSPAIKPANVGNRVFELRTYITPPGKVDAINARFRDHTVKLFAKHGMTNFGYWTPMAGQKGADNTLIYLLAHKSVEAAKASFGAFGKDPDWQAARKASEEKAGGSLTIPGGVKSEFLNATDYSPTK
ncbi:hypothetical protein LBMAG56_29060 [Verrucomicrobiota bacterium]|nr:hypothetical protein LBMAG56_29060 [Verrucomicrobiota bacterium]